jgi:hypothetical protein
MNCGVFTSPCGVENTPARAWPSVAESLKEKVTWGIYWLSREFRVVS